MGKVNDLLIANDLEGAAFFNDEYDTAIIGCTDTGCVVYSYEKMIEWLVEHDDMDYVDAQEYIDYNVVRSVPYMGEQKPVIVYQLLEV